MTYGDIITEFTQKFPNLDYEDIRPCHEMYGVPTINNAIVVWLKDKSKIIYITDKTIEEKDCNNCANATDDFNNDVDTGCYMCSKGLENNFVPIQTEKTVTQSDGLYGWVRRWEKEEK